MKTANDKFNKLNKCQNCENYIADRICLAFPMIPDQYWNQKQNERPKHRQVDKDQNGDFVFKQQMFF